MMRIIKFLVTLVLTLLISYNSNGFAKDKIALPKKVKDTLAQICHQVTLVAEDDLNAEMRKYLKENKKTYNTMLKGDFNGDKLADWALLVVCLNGKNKAQEKLIVMLQKPNKTYDVHILEEIPAVVPPPDDSVYICLVGPGKIQEWDSTKIVNIKHNSIERIYDEKSSGVFYWENGRFLYLQTSD